MILVLKQRIFSFLDSYDICDECGNCVFTVKSQLALGHRMTVYDNMGNEVGRLEQKIFHFLPTFEIYISGRFAGTVRREFTFFKPRYSLDYGSWRVDGDFFQWNYAVYDGMNTIMTVSKRLMHLSDTYEIDVPDIGNALAGVLIALAIDADKCSNRN